MLDNSREIASYIERNDGFLIITHFNPDGDAIGSSLGLVSILRDNGRRADFYMPSLLPQKYSKIIDNSLMVTGEFPDTSSYSSIICLDFSTPKRAFLPEGIKLEAFNTFLINIDHHPDNKLFGTLNIVKPDASACAEVIFDFAKFADLQISSKSAEFLLIGLLTDTGCFRFDNSNAKALRTAAELIDCGVDYGKLVNKLFLSKSLQVAKLEAEIVLKHLRTAFGGKFLWAILDEELFAKYGLEFSENEGMIDIIKCIEKAVVVAFIYKNNDGFRCSLRSKDKRISVGKIARALGGGGHEMAAGAFIETNIASEAERILLKKIEEALIEYEKA